MYRGSMENQALENEEHSTKHPKVRNRTTYSKSKTLRSVRTATNSGQYSPVRPSRSVSKKLLRGHPEVIPAEALWLTGLHTFVRRNRSFSEVKNLATGLLINSFSYFPNREKTAVNQPPPKNV